MPQLVLLAFVLSGISGITLEIVWTRQLELVFGATTLAISTVLTCFMGGLALGSWALGKRADRMRSPLLGYAVLEGIIGVSALAIPHLIVHVYPELNRLLVAHVGNNFLLFSLCRFAAVAVVLLVPTTCMGATLPLLSRHFVRGEGGLARVGSKVGLLYTLNTLGAIAGVFAATFALLPTLGLGVTNATAAGIDLAIAACIILFRRRLDPTAPAAPAADEIAPAPDEEPGLEPDAPAPFTATALQRNVAIAAFFVSGLASMNLQVVWNRALALVIGSSVYSFAIVLLAFLVGLAGGAAIFTRAVRRLANPVAALALAELAIALLAALGYLYVDDLPRVFAQLVTGSVEAYEEHVGFVQFLMFGVAVLAIVPVTLGMGATFPLTIRIAASSVGSVGRDVGNVYAMNTLGSICGSFLSAFVFVPFFSHYGGGIGMQLTFLLSIGLYALLAASLLLAAPGAAARRASFAAAIAVAAALFLLAAPRWDPARLTLGVFRISLMAHALDEESWGDPDVMSYYDGVTTTVSVELWGRHRSLKNNGKVDASNGDDMSTQVVVAAYPLLMHPRGTKDLDVAIVGLGSGVTVGAALQFPVRHIDCVELETAVVDAARHFSEVNHLRFRDPKDPAYDWTDPETYIDDDRLTVYGNDGRNFLATAEGKYDVIISEPSNPWITGVANMFTAESFRSSARALRKGGVFGQWMQLYEMSPDNIKTILRTFASVFPYVALFASEDLSSDTILVGSSSPLELDLGRVQRERGDARVAKELERGYITDAADIFARLLLVDRDELLRFADGPDRALWASLPVNTDDNARIEFAAPRDLITFSKFSGYIPRFYAASWPYSRVERVLVGVGGKDVGAARALARQALSLLGNGRKRVAADMIARAERIAPADPDVVAARRVAAFLTGDGIAPRPEIEAPAPGLEMSARDAEALGAAIGEVWRAVDGGVRGEGLERFREIPEALVGRGGPQLELLSGYLSFLSRASDDDTPCKDAVETLTQLVRGHPSFTAKHPEVHYVLGMCEDNIRRFGKAVDEMRRYAEALAERERYVAISSRQARADADAEVAGAPVTASIALPADAPGAPTTDAPGASPKDAWPAPLDFFGDSR